MTDRAIRVVRVGALVGALALGAFAAWFGAQALEGTFGVTGQPIECGSVWGLRTTDNLNAASCTDDLRTRVTVVGVLVTAAGLLAAVPSAVLGVRGPRARRVALSLSVALPVALGVLLVVLGRHRIWSVSGA